MREEVNIFLTQHVQRRFRERLGVSEATSMIGWIKSSLRHNAIRRVPGGSFRYRLKLRGTQYQVILSHEGKNTWVAVTLLPPPGQGRGMAPNDYQDYAAPDAQTVRYSTGKGY